MPITTTDPQSIARNITGAIECDDLYGLPDRVRATLPHLGFPQIAWSDSRAAGERWLALGEADGVSVEAGAGFDEVVEAIAGARARLVEMRASGLMRYVGGFAFDPRDARTGDWPDGGAARFVLPRVLLRQAAGDTRADMIVIGMAEPEAREMIREIGRIACPSRVAGARDGRVRLEPRVSAQRKEAWIAGVRDALREIASGKVRKVVLSQDIDLDAAAPCDPWSIARVIDARSPHGFRFCFRFDEGGAAFLGATPERLVAQRGRLVTCDCLAGTIARGDTPDEDRAQAARLHGSEKDRREHHFVLDGIREAIAPVAQWCESPSSPEILKLAKILHLSSPVRAWLRDGVGIGDLVMRIHPTPAVAGSPRTEAMDLIRRIEGRSRAWYAGAVGWIGADEADFAVAIRSAIVRDGGMTVFGGAGIVSGSDPEAEWEETARKTASLTSLFAESAE